MSNEDIELVEKSIQKCIRDGYSPALLLKNIFATIDKELCNDEFRYILYCRSFGGFSYSKEFIDYLRNNNMKLNSNYEYDYDRSKDSGCEIKEDGGMTVIPNSREIYHYIEQFAEFLNISVNEALKRASAKYCELEVEKVPKYRSYRINEYDGAENVEILNDFNF